MRLLLLAIISLSLSNQGLAADAKAGAAKAAVCVACHMPNGCSVNPIWPKLANQHQVYLLKQMKEIKAGTRKVPEMAPFLASLNDKDLENLAAHYAGLPPCPK